MNELKVLETTPVTYFVNSEIQAGISTIISCNGLQIILLAMSIQIDKGNFDIQSSSGKSILFHSDVSSCNCNSILELPAGEDLIIRASEAGFLKARFTAILI